MFGVISFFVLVESFVEFSKSIGNSFSRCDAFIFFLIFVMRTLFLAVVIPGTFRTPLNSSRILSMSCCPFFFFSDAFFKLLLRSFSRCFSSLDMVRLSSMSLRISASLSRHSSFFFAAADVVTCASLLSFSNTLALLLLRNTIEPASSTWSGTCAPRCSSELRSGCSSPSGRYFGSRSPARKSQLPLQPFLVREKVTRRRRRGSPWRSGAGYFPRSPGCRGRCAGQGAWGQRRGKRRWSTGVSRKGGRRESRRTTHV